MFILKTGHQPGVYVPLRALFLVKTNFTYIKNFVSPQYGRNIHVCPRPGLERTTAGLTDPLTPNFYIVKLEFTGVYIIFLFLL